MKKIDFHIYLALFYPIEKSVADIKEMCRKNGYETVCIQTLTHGDNHHIPDANETAFEVHKQLPGRIGKPSEYRDLNVKYDDPLIDEFFAYAQKEDIPVLLHHNDLLVTCGSDYHGKASLPFIWADIRKAYIIRNDWSQN